MFPLTDLTHATWPYLIAPVPYLLKTTMLLVGNQLMFHALFALVTMSHPTSRIPAGTDVELRRKCLTLYHVPSQYQVHCPAGKPLGL